ncbi:MAG: PadR family transcriptional regulator [Deltaproteobacteria bacterium]|nr:PadR family transcriptional regulator [Deltaproteobacteria bacterium]MBW1928289.1 PadR family transcriptional regulator [Deltaproteobacteria bacterium]MBW2025039.1 PadR family transcriptional regulator [Deltaproteobacteria bacterium]MBW2124468.1 PadR family transcriptional regulator [Deltaproteobacteria bacterium]
MKTRPASEYALLGALMSGPKHGYEILQFLDSSLGSTWYVGTSQLYSLLKRLEREGLVVSSVEPQETRPSKRVFSITPEGKKAFESWVYCPTEHVRDLRIEFLAKLFFFHYLSLKGGSQLLVAQIQVLEQIKERLKEKQQKEKDPYSMLVLRFKMTTLEAWLQWLIKEATPFIGEGNTRNCLPLTEETSTGENSKRE